MAPKKADGGGTARKGLDSQRGDPKKAQSAKGSDSARSSATASSDATDKKPKKKGLALAVTQIPVMEENLAAVEASERADALEQQIEVQKTQFEQQMQQSALAMEELFDQLTMMRKERDMAVAALQKALREKHGAGTAPVLEGSEGGSPSVGEALQEERLQATKDAYNALQLEHGHMAEECRRLRDENGKLQGVVASIKQLILMEPSALAARKDDAQKQESEMGTTALHEVPPAEELATAPAAERAIGPVATSNAAPAAATAPTAAAAAAAPATLSLVDGTLATIQSELGASTAVKSPHAPMLPPPIAIPKLDTGKAAATIQAHVRGRAARDQMRLLRTRHMEPKPAKLPEVALQTASAPAEVGALDSIRCHISTLADSNLVVSFSWAESGGSIHETVKEVTGDAPTVAAAGPSTSNAPVAAAAALAVPAAVDPAILPVKASTAATPAAASSITTAAAAVPDASGSAARAAVPAGSTEPSATGLAACPAIANAAVPAVALAPPPAATVAPAPAATVAAAPSAGASAVVAPASTPQAPVATPAVTREAKAVS